MHRTKWQSFVGSVVLGAAVIASSLGAAPALATHFTVTPGISLPSQSILNPVTNKLYVFGMELGGQAIAVVNAADGSLIKYIEEPVNTSVSQPSSLLFLNQAENKIYAVEGKMIFVIDGATDTISQTATLPTWATGAAYNAANNKLYVADGSVSVLDGDTLATLATITTASMNIGVSFSAPNALVLNPANNKLYIVYSTAVSSVLQIVDSTTDSIIAETQCTAADGCNLNTLRFGGGIAVAAINPADNSLWIGTDTTEPGTTPCQIPPATNPIPCAFPPAETFYRVDGVTDVAAQQFRTFGSVRSITGIDPATGVIYGMATNLPQVENAAPGTQHTQSNDFVMIDPANPVMTILTIDGTKLAAPAGASFSCGTGTIGAFSAVGLDIANGNIFFRCDATTFGGSSIVVAKLTDVAPFAPGVFPPQDLAGFVGQVSTTAPGSLFLGNNEAVRTVDSANPIAFPVMTDDSVVLLNAAALTSANVQFTAPVVTADYSLNVNIADTTGHGIPNLPVTVTGNGVNVSGVTDANGQFSTSGLLIGTYTVSYDPAGFIPTGATSQSVSVTADKAVSFVVTMPTSIASAQLSFASGAPLIAGPGVFIPVNIALSQPAPAGGIVVSLVSSNTKALKVPATATIAAGQSMVSVTAQTNGVSAAATASVTASYTGTFAPAGTSAISQTMTVYPTDTMHVTKATWSQSSQMLTVTATDNNPVATINVLLASNGVLIGTMTNLGNGNYSLQMPFASGTPSSVNLKSNLNGSTGQGVQIVN